MKTLNLSLILTIVSTFTLIGQPSNETMVPAGTVVVIGTNAHLTNPSDIPPILNDVTSDTVMLFLGNAMKNYEEQVNPPKLSKVQVITPHDYMGQISEGQTKSITRKDVSDTIVKNMSL